MIFSIKDALTSQDEIAELRDVTEQIADETTYRSQVLTTEVRDELTNRLRTLPPKSVLFMVNFQTPEATDFSRHLLIAFTESGCLEGLIGLKGLGVLDKQGVLIFHKGETLEPHVATLTKSLMDAGVKGLLFTPNAKFPNDNRIAIVAILEK